jgi:Protein of unknown function (DUF2846)
MINPIKFLPLLLIVAAGCASAPQSRSSAPSMSFATVYFYRPHSSPGGAVTLDIKDNGIDIGALPVGSYFQYRANSGDHLFTLTSSSTAQQQMNLQPGATYYVKADVGRNPLEFHPSLQVVFDLQGKTEIKNLTRLDYGE